MDIKIKTLKNDEEYLRQQSIEVDFNDLSYLDDIKKLEYYCLNNKVFALAAIQTGINKRLIYLKNTSLKNIDKDEYNEANVLINPTIIKRTGHTRYWESCASCLDYMGLVDRPYEIELVYYDINQKKHTKIFTGFEATVLSHEYDHLNGILHIDKSLKILEKTEEERREFRKIHGFKILSKSCNFDLIKKGVVDVEEFKYMVDSFEDIKVIRFLVPEFNSLSLKEKQYIYYLSQAAHFGRDINWLQLGVHNLFLRQAIDNVLKTFKGNKETKEYNHFLIYAKRIYASKSNYHHYGKYKFFPNCDELYLEYLLDNSNKELFKKEDNQSFEQFKNKIIDLIFSKEKNKTGDLLKDSFTNFYEDISEEEAKKYYDNKKNDDLKPLSLGLNSKLIKINNEFKEEVYKQNGLYGKYIQKIIENLKKANECISDNSQKETTELLIKFYETGDLRLWDDYNISWVKNGTDIDYINGFIEVYDDPIAIKGIYEAMVNIKDEKTSKITDIIASNADWFEFNSPIDDKFKKDKVEGIKASAIHAVTLGGDSYPTSPIGINLPNSDWIREKHGSKSVTITNLTEAGNKAYKELPQNIKGEFVYDKEQIELENKYLDEADDLHTHLHECLGHGSGKLLDGVSSNALKEYHSPLEEARADIFSLYYMADQKLIDLKIMSSLEVAKSYYSSYIRNGLQTQLVRLKLGEKVTQAHMIARKLISEYAYEIGKKDNVIERKVDNKKTYFVVNDYLKLRDIFKIILIELQRIKSTGDYEAGKKLVLKYGTEVDQNLYEETIERYKKLNLKPYTVFMNPEIFEVKENGEIIDYEITYPSDFIEQNLKYSEVYSV